LLFLEDNFEFLSYSKLKDKIITDWLIHIETILFFQRMTVLRNSKASVPVLSTQRTSIGSWRRD